MWYKVDISKNLWDGERKFFFNMKKEYEVPCVKLFIQLIYQEVSIYLKYYKPHLLLKIVEMWYNVDVLKELCYEERQVLFEMKKVYEVSCKILTFC